MFNERVPHRVARVEPSTIKATFVIVARGALVIETPEESLHFKPGSGFVLPAGSRPLVS